jgi:autotransporter-associated beta strand protein
LTNNLTVGGVIGDGGNGYALAVNGTGGTLTLTNHNTYTGNTTVSNAELILASPGAIYTAVWNPFAVVTIENGAVLQFDNWGYGPTASFGDLDFGSARLVVNGGTLLNVSVAGTASQRGCSVGPAGGTLNAGNSAWHIQYQDAYPTMTITGLMALMGSSTGQIDKGLIGIGGVTVDSSGIWILTGTNTYSGNTVINAGTLELTGSASIANSPLISVTNGATFDVSGLSATFNLASNQTLGGSGTINGNVTSGGTISPGPSAGTLNTLTFNNNLTFNGNLVFEVNTSLAQSNDVISATSITNAGTGTLTVTNLGPNLTVGEQFYLFNQPVPNGSALTISSPPGVTFTNHLALNGSIIVLSVVSINPNPTNLNYSVSGNTLHLSWPTDHLGWLVQSNSVNLTVPANWHDVPNSQNATSLSVTMNPGNSQVFYRLRHP